MAEKKYTTITYTHGKGQEKAYKIALDMVRKLTEGRELHIENENPPTSFSLRGEKVKVKFLGRIDIDGSMKITSKEIQLSFWVSHGTNVAKRWLRKKIIQAFNVPWHERPFLERVFG